MEKLLINGIEVHQATQPFAANGRQYKDAWVILMDQPFSPLVKELFEAQHYPELREGPNGPPVRPYDVAGWTLPMQMGVETVGVAQPVTNRDGLQRIEKVDAIRGGVEGTGGVYLLSRRRNNSFAALNELLTAGGQAAFSGDDVVVSGLNRDRLAEIANKHSVMIQTAAKAPEKTLATKKPRVGLYRSWTAAIDEGWTRWILENHGFAPVTLRLLHGRVFRHPDGEVVGGQIADHGLSGHGVASPDRGDGERGGALGIGGLDLIAMAAARPADRQSRDGMTGVGADRERGQRAITVADDRHRRGVGAVQVTCLRPHRHHIGAYAGRQRRAVAAELVGGERVSLGCVHQDRQGSGTGGVGGCGVPVQEVAEAFACLSRHRGLPGGGPDVGVAQVGPRLALGVLEAEGAEGAGRVPAAVPTAETGDRAAQPGPARHERAGRQRVRVGAEHVLSRAAVISAQPGRGRHARDEQCNQPEQRAHHDGNATPVTRHERQGRPKSSCCQTVVHRQRVVHRCCKHRDNRWVKEYVALLGRINVGGHTTKMAELREIVGELGYTGVGTYIQTGNVFFRATVETAEAAEKALGKHLTERLGYEIPTFVRTVAELKAAAETDPFAGIDLTEDTRFMVLLMSAKLPADVKFPIVDEAKGFRIISSYERELFLVLSLMKGRPGNPFPWLEKTYGVTGSGRFAHTMAKLLEAAGKHFAS